MYRLDSKNNSRKSRSRTQQRQNENEVLVERYRMEPRQRFETSRAYKIMEEVVQALFNNEGDIDYNEERFRGLSKRASELIKDEVKKLDYSRCRIVSLVYAGQYFNQSCTLQMSSIMLSDKEVDGFAEYSLQKRGFFVTAVVYGIHKLWRDRNAQISCKSEAITDRLHVIMELLFVWKY